MGNDIDMSTPEDKKLTPAEIKRIERFKRINDNRRNRKNPSSVPAKLTRTSAFTPRRRGLNTDSRFNHLYIVPKHSVIRVSGRELGSHHRDALYVVFRLKRKTVVVADDTAPIGRTNLYQTQTTWRELLTKADRTHHTNNIMILMRTFEEIKQVVMTVYEGNPEHLLEEFKRGTLPDAKGAMGNIIHDIQWDGLGLDDRVIIQYGSWTADMITKGNLVSMNTEVQVKLKSDHAKTFWPYIDSQNNHTFVDESMLGFLSGRDLWNERETSASRAQFRKDCKKAFDDMVKAGGLVEWRSEVRGSGQKKTRRYHYTHALPRQIELDFDTADAIEHQA